jgi:hypothetical protein
LYPWNSITNSTSLRAVLNEIFPSAHAHIIRPFKVKKNSPFLRIL